LVASNAHPFQMRELEVPLQVERGVALFDRALVVAGEIERPAERPVGHEREMRVALLRAPHLPLGFVEAPGRGEEIRVPLVRGGVARVDRDGTPEHLLCRRPTP
jgi:hypothetical protein